MSGSINRRAPFNSRPLYATLLIVTLLATYALFLRPHVSQSTEPSRIFARAAEATCDDIHESEDQCAFVKAYCLDEEPGLVSYLSFYYCTLPKAKPLAFTVLALWLGLLFSTIGIAASDFFSVNLSTIASVLGLPESLAGVTFLAFGNGSPDVFSTFAAMKSNSGSMAVGELIGAAGFISAVVAGSMALVREFKVSKKTFVRDIVFFILAISFTMLFLLDGKMHLWECALMIGFYLFYVCFVVVWHWYSTSRRRKRSIEAASRSHFSAATSHVGDEIEPYHDDPEEDDDDGSVGPRGRSRYVQDISALEYGPRTDAEPSSQDDEDEDKNRQVASEMTSSMRVNRPRRGRNHSTITPIRPSLVGALEFRSVMSSLAKSRNMRMAPLQRGYSYHNSAGLLARSTTGLGAVEPYRDNPNAEAHLAPPPYGRDRAFSSGDVSGRPFSLRLDASSQSARQPSVGRIQEPHVRSSSVSTLRQGDRPLSVAQRAVADRVRPSGPMVPVTKDGHLAPPGGRPISSGLSTEIVASPPERDTPALSLVIPSSNIQASRASSPAISPNMSPAASPFPAYDSLAGTSTPGPMRSVLPTPAVEYDRIPGLDPPDFSARPVRWWPYDVLPPPHDLWRTLLPTLQGWREKSIWDKVFSLISMPTVFLLVITLPVVETDAEDNLKEDEDGISTLATPAIAGVHAPAISVEDGATLQPETEWQEYRRRAHSVRSRSSSASRLHGSYPNSLRRTSVDRFPFPIVSSPGGAVPDMEEQGRRVSRDSGHGLGSEPTTEDENTTWNRWLVAIQIVMGPLFTCFIIWAKHMDEPPKTLLMMVLYSLLGSLLVLSVLLLVTSPDTKPRYHFLFCFLGFVISIAWISTIAEEVVGILKAIGVILGMSEAILGLTIFAVGNSVGDLVADITVARLGYPVMALSACFGGPMLNILLGIGLGGTYMSYKSATHEHSKHPDLPVHFRYYHIEVTGTLFISAITVLVTLLTQLILVPTNKWIMTRRTGLILIALWSVGTVVNVIVEVTGAWQAVEVA